MEIEVSLKVRSAIKAKLMELGVHVDDELPDYIMVLVANRRSKPQMESDLELFLSENTQKFSTWLFHVLKKLEQVTLADPAPAVDTKGDSATEAQPRGKEASKKTEVKSKSDKTKDCEEKIDSSKTVKKTSATSSKSKTALKPSSSSSTKSGSGKSDTKTKRTETERDVAKGESKDRERKSSRSGSMTSSSVSDCSKSTEKPTETKVQFKLKNNLVKQTEFDRKQTEIEHADRKGLEISIQDSSPSATGPEPTDPNASTLDHDILNLGGDEVEDFLEGDTTVAEPSTKTTSNPKPKKDSDEEDVDKLRKIALETKSPSSRRKLGSGNVSALRGMVMSFEKENTNKRKRPSDEATESSPKESSKRDSPPRKLRSVISVTTKPKPAEEYDPEQPRIHRLSSIVCVTGDKRPKRNTTSMNSNLIMKAMKAVEIDNIKRPLVDKEASSKSKRHRDNSWEGDRSQQVWRIARSPRSRSRDRDRHHRERSRGDHDHRRHSGSQGRVRRNSSHDRIDRVRRDFTKPRSKSPPLQLFTKRGRMSIKDRLGEKQISSDNPEPVKTKGDEDEVDETYLNEIQDIENDLNIIINVPNLPSNKDSELDVSPKPVEEIGDTGNFVRAVVTRTGGYVAPKRISIQVMNSSDESDSEDEPEPNVVMEQGSESEAELEVSVNHDPDIDDLLPPQQQKNEDSNEEEKEKEEEKKIVEEKPDRLSDLRAKLAAITRANTASYSPLPTVQPTRPLASVASVLTPRPTAPYFAPYFYDSLPTLTPDPSSTCKFWPTCSFGDSCKFTHPICKFGSGCVKRSSCPFKHDVELRIHPKPSTTTFGTGPPVGNSKKLCRFFPKCNSMDCAYYHPKPCRYGVNCTDSTCVHYHPGSGSIGEKKSGKLPAIHQLKWKKDKTQVGDSPVEKVI